MSHYITEFEIGTDLEQPHNFVKINGKSPILRIPIEHFQQPNYTKLYEWIDLSDFGLNETFFDSVLTKREFEANVTTVIINSSTAKLRMEFMKNVLFVETDIAKQQQLERSLLILDPVANIGTNIKPIHIFNLPNGSGKRCIYSKNKIKHFVVQ